MVRDRETPVSCRICGSQSHVQVYAARAHSGLRERRDVSPYSCASHSGRSHGAILRCLNCGIVFMQPKLLPEELVKEYSKVVDPVYLDNFPARLVTFQRTLARVRSHFPVGARVLEVGSYCGAFLKVAREAGLDVIGLEPSAWAIEQARRATDAQVIQGTLDDLPPALTPFDVIAAWDVVEHFADPVGELVKVNRALCSNGTFVFCTVMIDNWFPRLVGSRWPWFMDMHLFYFTRETIAQVLNQAGFAVLDSMPYLHITTPEYLLRKLGTLGLPGASTASRIVAKTPWARAHIPVRLGDIQLFVARKVRDLTREAALPVADADRRASARSVRADR
jgi:SAM-dependent methyltransferase